MKTLHRIRIEKSKILEIVKRVFPEAEIVSVSKMKRGIMNLVLLVKIKNPCKELVLRLSDKKTKRHSLQKEKYVYGLLKGKIPLAEIYEYDFSKKIVPYEYMLLSKLPGHCLEDIWDEISPKEQKELAVELGKTMAKINSVNGDKFGYIIGDGEFHLFDRWKDFITNCLREAVKDHKKLGFIDSGVLNAILETYDKYESLLLQEKKPCLIHIDFHFWHIFVDKKEKYKVTGVIDFEFSEFGVRGLDLHKPHRWIFNRGKEIEKAFLKGYNSVYKLPKNIHEQILLYRLYADLKFIQKLVGTNQIDMANEYVGHIKNHLKLLSK